MQTIPRRIINVVAGIFGAGFSAFLGSIISTETFGVTQVIPGQIALQLALGLFMFGYYVGMSFKENSAIAEFLSGYLGAAISFGLWLSRSQMIGLNYPVGIICGIGLGIFVGAQRPLFGRTELDRGITLAVNAGGWSIQIVGTVASVSASINLDISPLEFIGVPVLVGLALIGGYLVYGFVRGKYIENPDYDSTTF